MVALTDTAKAIIRRLIERSPAAATAGLRIRVEEGGCAGLKYLLGVETEARRADQVLDFDGARLFIDPFSLPILAGMAIDYVEGIEASGFVFDNPGAGERCSCGRSFAP